MIKVLYVNHKSQKCGVYEHGKSIGECLEKSTTFNIKYIECDSFSEFKLFYESFKAKVIIYNYHPATMSWVLSKSPSSRSPLHSIKAIHIGTIHEVYQELADNINNELFDFHIAPDPTLLLKNPIVYKTNRLLPEGQKSTLIKNVVPIISSFGFATLNKGFEKIIPLVEKEFDEAIINLNIPFAKFGDEDGKNAKRIAEKCRNLITKDGIQLNINHDYLDRKSLLEFLSKSTINVFMYDEVNKRGISSATDWALASKRPLAISKSSLFRHLLNCEPSICVDDNSLKEIIQNDTKPIEHLWKEYSPEVLMWDYNRIINDVLYKEVYLNYSKNTFLKFYLRKIKNKLLSSSKTTKIPHNIWTKISDDYNYVGTFNKNYKYQESSKKEIIYNKILDNKEREFYKPAIEFFINSMPSLINKKIPEANVQQAFVFDSAIRLCKNFKNPKLLAVGAYEDTAAIGLKLLGYNIDFIDPILNYDLETYISKPIIEKESYDIIISTSVIEHVKDDEKFVKDIAYLLKKGGKAILTCDYNDIYKDGDAIPSVDYRFYTKKDLEERLMASIKDCKIIDEPFWECENPDFYLADKYNYTFATLVFEKHQ